MDWFLKRLREPTTYMGLGAAVAGVSQALKIEEGPAVADALAGAGQAMASGHDAVTVIALTFGGVLSAILRERAEK